MPLYKHGTFHLCEGAWNTQLRLWSAKTEENRSFSIQSLELSREKGIWDSKKKNTDNWRGGTKLHAETRTPLLGSNFRAQLTTSKRHYTDLRK